MHHCMDSTFNDNIYKKCLTSEWDVARENSMTDSGVTSWRDESCPFVHQCSGKFLKI